MKQSEQELEKGGEITGKLTRKAAKRPKLIPAPKCPAVQETSHNSSDDQQERSNVFGFFYREIAKRRVQLKK